MMSNYFKNIHSRLKSRSFWDGFVSGLTCWLDAFEPPALYRERRDVLYEKYDINQALRSDWEKVSKDMWKAIKQVENEIEKDKTSH